LSGVGWFEGEDLAELSELAQAPSDAVFGRLALFVPVGSELTKT
jgi:hypothetical protein